MPDGIEPDLVPVRVVQLGQDPPDAGPVYAACCSPSPVSRAASRSIAPLSGTPRAARPPVDLEWLIDTTTILAAAETYLLITRLTSWDLDTYQDWLATTGARLARVADGNS